MEMQVIREMTTAELSERLDEERKQLTKLKLNHAVSPLENPNKIKDYKRTIAQMMTELKRREIEGDIENNEPEETK
ncbi:MAG: 50S ribosomal protein L29 [Bacteroidota bacterium]|nr:50S ribosomal protein L29 [Bacteroidota bacterium]